MFELRPLSHVAIPGALAKAERYRLLNEPEQSASICEDILAAEPGNQAAVVGLVLALTDGFRRSTQEAGRAAELAAGLTAEYDRHYFGGLVAERRARALLAHGGMGRRAASHWLHQAMRDFDRADALHPQGNEDARLRWNACARVFNARPELASEEEQPLSAPMLE